MLWPGGSSPLEGYPFKAEKRKFSGDRPLMWLISETFRVVHSTHGELYLSFLFLKDDEDDILRPSCQYRPSLDGPIFLASIVSLARSRGAY